MARRHRSKGTKKVRLDGSFIHAARKHGIFVVADDLGVVDFLDVTTGKSLGIWKLRPWPQYIIKGFATNGSMWNALQAIIDPYPI